MQGVRDRSGRRFQSKKALKERAQDYGDDSGTFDLEATSVFGNEYDGPIENAPNGTYYVVGPDPYTSRKWYAQVIKTDSGIKVK
jgi:hypothetical protein